MATHVKVLAVLYLVVSGLLLLAALVILVTLGGAAALVGVTAPAEDAAVAVPALGLAGSVLAVFFLVLALPGLVAGWGLLNFRPWARILTIVLSALNLINFPIGTALGLYGLWVLLSRDTEPLFRSPAEIRPA